MCLRRNGKEPEKAREPSDCDAHLTLHEGKRERRLDADTSRTEVQSKEGFAWLSGSPGTAVIDREVSGLLGMDPT